MKTDDLNKPSCDDPFGPAYTDESLLQDERRQAEAEDANNYFVGDLSPNAILEAEISTSSLPTHPTLPTLFPRESVNFFVFTPKLGTFRFLLPQLNNYAAGLPVLEIPHPCPESPEQLGLILCAKQSPDIRNKITSMGLEHLADESVFPIVKWNSTPPSSNSRRCQMADDETFPLDLAYQRFLDYHYCAPTFLIVESIHLLLRAKAKLMDPTAIGQFMDRLHEFCHERHCTILGTIPTAKPTPGDERRSLSHRIYGSVQWGVSASSVMVIERYSDTSQLRQIRVEASLSTAENLTYYADFGLDGRLELRPQPESPLSARQAKLSQIIDAWAPEQRYTRGEILMAAKELAKGEGVVISTSTIDRWLYSCVDKGVLIRDGQTHKATYWRPRSGSEWVQ